MKSVNIRVAALALAGLWLTGCDYCGYGKVCGGSVWLDEYQCWAGAEHPPTNFYPRQDLSITTVGPDGRCWRIRSIDRPPDWGPPGAAFDEACTDEVMSGPTCYRLLGYEPLLEDQ